jgi:uncharacterized membrane protein
MQALDVVRGVAILGMFFYHLSFDLAFFGAIPPSFPFLWPMRMFSHLVACTFLALVGISLALAYADRPLGTGFARRLIVLWAAAGAVSLGTYVFVPEAFISFGILHCIAAASVLGGLATRAPVALSVALGALLIGAPPLADALGWHVAWPMALGLSGQEPVTLDWRPFAPWGGVTFLAYAAARSALGRQALQASSTWRSPSPLARAPALLGRHSLMVYLVHQPIFFAALYTYLWASNAFGR